MPLFLASSYMGSRGRCVESGVIVGLTRASSSVVRASSLILMFRSLLRRGIRAWRRAYSSILVRGITVDIDISLVAC